jgi:hypothetical protein
MSMKDKQMSFVSNVGKFKLYSVPNGLLFSTPTQLRFLFERMIPTNMIVVTNIKVVIYSLLVSINGTCRVEVNICQ